MKAERHGLFTELEPPPGGAERFGRRLDETASSRHVARWGVLVAAGAACAAAILVVIVVLRDSSSSLVDSQRTASLYDAPEFDRLLGRSPQPVELAVTLNEQTASVVEIETTNEKVRIYRIN